MYSFVWIVDWQWLHLLIKLFPFNITNCQVRDLTSKMFKSFKIIESLLIPPNITITFNNSLNVIECLYRGSGTLPKEGKIEKCKGFVSKCKRSKSEIRLF